MNNDYLIYGAGGQARVLKDLISTLGNTHKVLCFFNDSNTPTELGRIPVLPYDASFQPNIALVLGIGNSKVRKMLTEKVAHPFVTLIHPKASIANDVEIGEGTVVLAGAVIQSGAKIGKHVIINANVTIDHDAIVEDYVTTYPGVYVGAEATIAEGTTINPNVVIMKFMKTEAFSEIAPGQVVLRSI